MKASKEWKESDWKDAKAWKDSKNWEKMCGGGMGHHGGSGALYGLGFLGALVYFLSRATDLWTGVIGLFKAIFWPAFLVHGLLKFLGL